MKTDQSELDSNTYKALGRYVVAFSGLLNALESSTVHLVTRDSREMKLLDAALGDRTASPIVAAYFAVFYTCWEGQMYEKDFSVMKCLRRELEDVVKERNRLMHDAWLSSAAGAYSGTIPMTQYRKRAHGTGVDYESVFYPPEKLELLSDDLNRLSSIVNATAWYGRRGQSGPELSKRFQVVDNRVFHSN